MVRKVFAQNRCNRVHLDVLGYRFPVPENNKISRFTVNSAQDTPTFLPTSCWKVVVSGAWKSGCPIPTELQFGLELYHYQGRYATFSSHLCLHPVQTVDGSDTYPRRYGCLSRSRIIWMAGTESAIASV